MVRLSRTKLWYVVTQYMTNTLNSLVKSLGDYLTNHSCLICRPDTPDMSSDHTPRIVSSSSRSSVLADEAPDHAPNASSPLSSSQKLQSFSANVSPSAAPNPFAAMALLPASSTDLSEAESDAETVSTLRSSFDWQEPRHSSSHASTTRSSRAVPKSPKSPSRAHAQQPLDESECGKPLLAKLSMMERTHSAPGTAPLPSRKHAYT